MVENYAPAPRNANASATYRLNGEVKAPAADLAGEPNFCSCQASPATWLPLEVAVDILAEPMKDFGGGGGDL